MLESLSTRGVDLHSASLMLLRQPLLVEPPTKAMTEEAFAHRVPVREVLDPLIAIRRHLASDSEQVLSDLSPLSSPVRAWAAVTERLEDLLPDERGLDLIDSLLLDELAREGSGVRARCPETWPQAATVVALHSVPKWHYFCSNRLYERLLELSGIITRAHVDCRNLLVQAWFRGEANFAWTHFRLTALGQRVRAGKEDALSRCRLVRWVGGRMISRDRPLRRPLRKSG
jgi:hypothetical protein